MGLPSSPFPGNSSLDTGPPGTGWGTTTLVWGPTPHSCFFCLQQWGRGCDAVNRNQLPYLWRRLVPDKTLDFSLFLKVFIKTKRLKRLLRCSVLEEWWGCGSCYGTRAGPLLRLLLAQQQGKTLLWWGCRAVFFYLKWKVNFTYQGKEHWRCHLKIYPSFYFTSLGMAKTEKLEMEDRHWRSKWKNTWHMRAL